MAPIALYLSGLARKSLISLNSATASSAPATSANVLVGISLLCNFARDLPNENTLPPCPPPMNKSNKNIINKIGRILRIKETKNDCFGTSTSQFVVGGLLVNNSTIKDS
ncbi:unannotated protein [freshwater metagenome]|uniref:Unannotated protein n=1 Tax=freshwater metagenome TaxID=449393 RepID=A0A6J6FVQ1_9ZZZZ